MKINIVGGGPAGLYSAILLKLQEPMADVAVYERNDRNSTFGFGIVLSAETLAKLDAADPVSGAAIRGSFSYWDDLYVQFKGENIKSTGHGYSGLERLALLQILARRAEELGVRCLWNNDISDFESLRDADLVIASDGVNSAVRQAYSQYFKPDVQLRNNRFVWLGTNKPLPGFTFMFRENEHGIWIVHAYQYKPGHSTFVVETTAGAFERAGLSETDEDATARYLRAVFREELDGHQILTNRSYWRRFPAVHCEHWHHGNMVLIGDAAHTAHFSIGSGTKLALEDAISLARNLKGRWSDVPAALAAYEEDRRPRSARVQVAANISLRWFESIEQHFALPPWQFSFSLVTRSKQITYEKMKLRDAAYVAQVADSLREGGAGEVEPVETSISVGPIAIPHRLVPTAEVAAAAGPAYFAIAASGDGLAIGEESLAAPRTGKVFGLRIASTMDEERALAAAMRAKAEGAALIHVALDQSSPAASDPLVLCERLRVAASLPVMLCGDAFSRDDMNTAIAAGRVDIFARTNRKK